MSQQSYPPPPPPARSPARGGLHGPATNLFPSIRKRLVVLEQPSQPAIELKRRKGLITALILGATVSVALSLVVQIAANIGGLVYAALVAPFTEEPFKALSILIAALFVWKIVPNRRYGAALGASAGLGFGIAESTIFIIGFLGANATADQITTAIVVRIIVTPFMHPLWSAFVGIGIFVLLSKSNNRISSIGLALLFLIIGLIAHMIWNSFASGLQGYGYLSVLLDMIITFPIFAIVLRDFLGGHFNLQDFFSPVPEPFPPQTTAAPPIPPPPPS